MNLHLGGFFETHHRVQIPFFQHAVDMLEGNGLQTGMQLRPQGAQLFQSVRDEKHTGKVVEPDGQSLDVALYGAFKPLFGPVGKGHDLLGVPPEGLSLFGHPHRAGSALEQLYVQFLFQRLNLLADGRVGHMERLGRLGKAQIFRHRQKAGELKCVHGSCLLFD